MQIVTGTRYPKYGSDPVDTLRGDLALELAKKTVLAGFGVVAVDSDSPRAFKEKLENLGALVVDQEYPGMSMGRQQGFWAADSAERCGAVLWVEPEKEDMAKDIERLVEPILHGRTSLTVPRRISLESYPDYQREAEEAGNREFSNLLRETGLLESDTPDLDLWFGPKAFDTRLIHYFMANFGVDVSRGDINNFRPDQWANATFLPIIWVLWAGGRVESVDVDYTHPSEQTSQELKPELIKEFQEKRAIQRRNIVEAGRQFIYWLQNDPRCRLELLPGYREFIQEQN